jgi:hypothetical protein
MRRSPDSFYHDSYTAHREQFILGCREAAGAHDAVVHPLRGPFGETLAVDVARFGSPLATRLLIVVSGTHGIEGFCGSAIQAAMLEARIDLPPNVGLLLVHGLNPYGFAWRHRTDADNIDLNRNFRDFTQPAPANPAYEEIHGALVPSDWSGPARAAADGQLRCYIRDRGMRALQAAVFGGQYAHADGLVFGGRRPSWSNEVWHRILAAHASDIECLAVLDVHSGLGAPGACELISGAREGSAEFAAAQAWFGSPIVFPGRTSTAPAAQGYMGDSLTHALPHAIASLVVAEFGTAPIEQIFDVLRADNWVRAHETPRSPLWQRTKTDMYEAFVLPAKDWKAAIVEHGMALGDRLIVALGEAQPADFGR